MKGEIKSKEDIAQKQKIMKSGPIEDPDRLFNNLAKHIGDMYKEVGVDLGLSFKELENELETGALAMKPASKKALKMLHIWKDSEEDLTYSKLAAALEKNGFTRCADDLCYTTATASEQ